jgi:outer membrane protein assembly factor BamB
MAGRALVHVRPTGEVELCDVDEGEPYAVARFTPRAGTPARGTFVSGPSIPPTAILTAGPSRLTAIDLRTGQSRWEFTATSPSPMRLAKAGRALVVSSAHAVDAVDVTSGEIVWRFTTEQRLVHDPVIHRDVVLLGYTDLGSKQGGLIGIDLFTGERRFHRTFDAVPNTHPMAAGPLATVSLGGPRRPSLAALAPESGELRWMVPDPGLSAGGAAFAVDRQLVFNTPLGRAVAIDVDTGETRWRRDLADPVADEVPRRLEPILRGGALFVPAAAVHVLRVSDGTSIGSPLPSNLIPDLLRVDERGWIYVAEESGHIGAYAPMPNLTLIRGAG